MSVMYEEAPLEGISEAKAEVDEETKEAVEKGGDGCRQA